MRSRDVTIPLTLWICAAICAHFLFGTGGAVVAQIHDDRSELWKLSREASELAKHGASTIEVTLGDGESKDEAPPPTPPPAPTPDAPKPEPTAPPPPKVQPPPKPEEKKPEEKKVLVAKKPEEKKDTPPPPEPKVEHRIAVRQHVNPDQKDNPEAKFIADEANRVQNETVATQTSHDRDEANPTPAGAHRSAEQNPGDSERQRIAEAEAHKGEKNRAPGEHGTDFDVLHEPKLPKASSASPTTGAEPQNPQRAMANDEHALSPAPGQREPEPAQGGDAPASPDVENAPNGSWSFDPTRPEGAPGAQPMPSSGAANPQLPGGKLWALPGLGQAAAPGAMNTNINPGQIASIVGEDNLRKLREADGERRKSEHRGAWQASNFDRWRSAIENYVSSVKPGNQTSLNAARVPFASYLNGMHNRIHPIFADSFLESLDALPAAHPMNDKHLMTRVEIVLTRDGHLKRMGIVSTSGITAFDIAALDAVDRAAPFGPAPSAIISPDGNVYLHWDFHRDEVFACSTNGAHPYILNNPAGPKNEGPAPPVPGPAHTPQERGAPSTGPNDAREGSLEPPSVRGNRFAAVGSQRPALARLSP
jgi:TonB family protein